jgi:DNA-3-methyladenine glycosylase I
MEHLPYFRKHFGTPAVSFSIVKGGFMTDRCGWEGQDPLYISYHDIEWGVPVHDDRVLFEFLVLESAQAGLSWITILRKRENYRRTFDGFDPLKVASYDNSRMEELMKDSGIIKNRKKILSSIRNARVFLEVVEEFGSFDRYLWGFTGRRQIHNSWSLLSQVPSSTDLSRKISSDMKKRGFTFVGPTIMYSFMQATGMVNDHLVSCFRHGEIKEGNFS